MVAPPGMSRVDAALCVSGLFSVRHGSSVSESASALRSVRLSTVLYVIFSFGFVKSKVLLVRRDGLMCFRVL